MRQNISWLFQLVSEISLFDTYLKSVFINKKVLLYWKMMDLNSWGEKDWTVKLPYTIDGAEYLQHKLFFNSLLHRFLFHFMYTSSQNCLLATTVHW